MAQSNPLYRRIAADLREAMRTGELRPGDRLPTEQELGERYGVSRNTVRLALGMLTNEGAITSTPGRGTFVRDRAMTTYHASWAEQRDRMSSDQADAYRAELASQGRQPEYRDFDMRIVPATVELAERLCVDEGDSLVSRSFLRLVDGEPSSLQDSYYPMDIAQECGLITPHDIPQGTVRAMANHGHVEVGYVDEILTRMPSPDEVRKLSLGAGVPVLVYVRTAYTKQRPVRLTLTTFAGDRNRVVYELGELDAYHREQPAP
ncbi:GntR family transcriptional regulator [Planosporangium sp. 12N6]|uniref:GntR family transcriptional regulator n=1 Tax=Planosporangium spinosum TaxID=3402278 RepID=UPI003CF9A570